jgi:hypothetical protein
MTALRAFRHATFSLAASLAILLGAGCSRLMPVRHGSARSVEIVVDTRQDPLEALSGCVIPEVLPARTKWPVIFDGRIPAGAVITDATCETVQQSGDPLSPIETVIENNQVYVEFAAHSVASISQAHLVVHANYTYRW